MVAHPMNASKHSLGSCLTGSAGVSTATLLSTFALCEELAATAEVERTPGFAPEMS